MNPEIKIWRAKEDAERRAVRDFIRQVLAAGGIKLTPKALGQLTQTIREQMEKTGLVGRFMTGAKDVTRAVIKIIPTWLMAMLEDALAAPAPDATRKEILQIVREVGSELELDLTPEDVEEIATVAQEKIHGRHMSFDAIAQELKKLLPGIYGEPEGAEPRGDHR